MSLDLRDQLLKLVNNDDKRNIIISKYGDEFIKDLSEKFVEESSIKFKEGLSSMAFRAYHNSKIIQTLAKDALSNSLDWSESIACFIYLTNYLIAPNFFLEWVYEWLREAYEKYPNSVLLKFLYAYAINFYKGYEYVFSKSTSYRFKINHDTDSVPPWINPELKNQFENLKIPHLNSTQLILEALKADPNRIMDIQETYVYMWRSAFEKYPFQSKFIYENFGKLLFPDLSYESYLHVFISSVHTQLAYYSSMAGLKDKASKELEKALFFYKDDSYALVVQGWLILELEEDSIKAEFIFKKILQVVDRQYIGLPLQSQIKISAYLGLGYIYYKRTIYDVSEKYYCNAMKVESDPYWESIILLNRGRNRLDSGDFAGAKEDFHKAQKEPLLAPYAYNNLGLIYYEQGLYEKAESKFIQAIELKSDLPDAYYNLGVLYNDEGNKGNKERTKKLFQTALNIDRNYKEAKDALKKLRSSDISSIGDWYDWWFSTNSSSLKKGMGIATLILIGILIGKASYDALLSKDIKESTFGIIAIAITFLVLPLISKLKVGPVELEMESRGERPPLG